MKKILIIDDDHDILDYLNLFFKSVGINTVLSDNYDDGINKFKKERPDAVLLDIILEDKSGIELLKEIKALKKDVPVAMITATQDASKIIDAFRNGADDCLLKPFNLDYIKNVFLPKIK